MDGSLYSNTGGEAEDRGLRSNLIGSWPEWISMYFIVFQLSLYLIWFISISSKGKIQVVLLCMHTTTYTSNTCTFCTKKIHKHLFVLPSYYPRLCSFHASQGTSSVIQQLCNEAHFSSTFKFANNPCSHGPMMRGSVGYPFSLNLRKAVSAFQAILSLSDTPPSLSEYRWQQRLHNSVECCICQSDRPIPA